jgi:hypothetical protein
MAKDIGIGPGLVPSVSAAGKSPKESSDDAESALDGVSAASSHSIDGFHITIIIQALGCWSGLTSSFKFQPIPTSFHQPRPVST